MLTTALLFFFFFFFFLLLLSSSGSAAVWLPRYMRPPLWISIVQKVKVISPIHETS